jgi:hypothetical protein
MATKIKRKAPALKRTRKKSKKHGIVVTKTGEIIKKDDRLKNVIYRSAATGKFVTKKFALKNPDTTVKEKRKSGGDGTDYTGPRKNEVK